MLTVQLALVKKLWFCFPLFAIYVFHNDYTLFLKTLRLTYEVFN